MSCLLCTLYVKNLKKSLPQLQYLMTSKLDWAIPWPVQDYWSSNPVMPVEPLEAMMRGKFNKVPVMTGNQGN